MSWRAETDHGQLAQHTVFAVFKEPWVDGSPAESLPAGVTLGERFPNGAPFTIEVVEVTADSAVIKTSDQTSWRMTEVSPKQLQIPTPSSAGAPATYWVINEQVTT